MKQLLLSLAFVFTLPSLGHSAPALRTAPALDIKKIVMTEEIAKDAYLWGYPLVRFERTKQLMTKTPGFGHAPLNNFFHTSRLPSPKDREISTPLPDSLYSSAFLDLRNQPMVLQTPKIKDRFYSLQIMDAYTDSIAFISSRTRGEVAGKFFITGPHYIGATPAGFEHIRSATNFVWIGGHIAAASPSQEKSAYRIIRKYDLRPYNVYLGREKLQKAPRLTAKANPAFDPRRVASAGIGYYNELGIALRENEPSNLNPALMARFRTIDVGPGLRTSRRGNVREVREAYERAVASGEIEIDRIVKKDLISIRNGWTYTIRSNEIASNYPSRAALSKVYFGESNAAEAIHPVTYVDSNNARLNGNSTYILRFAKEKMPPVGAFWSVAAYNIRGNNFAENSLKRYALGSYSKDLTLNPDGSIDIYISANEPTGHTSNWLPSPRGSFYVMMNMYNPTNDVINGKYILPRPQKLTTTPILSLNK
jgi:hypothetical protein